MVPDEFDALRVHWLYHLFPFLVDLAIGTMIYDTTSLVFRIVVAVVISHGVRCR